MLHGLAVTWDNPDIVLQKDGKSVSSSALEPDTTYEVVARIWNASKLCPVVSMPVYFGFLSFGVGTKYTQIGKTYVDLGVKGGPDCPAFAKVQWKTPREAGHYCIQVFLAPPDDLNYLNNLGQENTQVVAAHSPATLTFQLRNDSPVDRRFHFEVDGYELPKLPPCPTGVEAQPVATNVPILMGQVDYKQEAFGRRAQPDESRIAGQRRGAVPLPLGWQVLIAPEHPVLKPEDEITVTVTANPPPGFAGEQRININAFTEEKPAGGVTMIVTAGH